VGERREALRLLLVARRSAVDGRREALSQLRAGIVTAPDRLREELRGLPVGRLLERCSRLRRTSKAGADELATRLVLRSLAHRVQAATREANELERELLGHVPTAEHSDTDSAAAATANSTARCTQSCSTAASTTPRLATTSLNESPKAKTDATQHDYSSATPPATSTDYSNKPSR
jgi:hypothetical protein